MTESVRWDEIEEILESELEQSRQEDVQSVQGLFDDSYDTKILFERDDSHTQKGTRYVAETDIGSIEVHTSGYPDIDTIAYDPTSTEFALETSQGEVKHYSAAIRNSCIGAIGEPFDQTTWKMYYKENSPKVGGKIAATNDYEDITSSEIRSELQLMIDIKNSVSDYLSRDEESNIVLTPRYQEDVARLERGGRLARGSGKLSTLGENLELCDPNQVFFKRMNNRLSPVLQARHGKPLRAWFLDGRFIDKGENDKIYGLRVLDKNKEEQEKLAERIRRNNTFYDDVVEYANSLII